MNTPKYIVKKANGRLITVPLDTRPAATAAWIVGGTCLALRGLHRGGLRGGVAFFFGAGFIVRGALGYNPLTICRSTGASGHESPAQPPSYQNDAAGRAPQLPQDLVDEQSMESFPASDPPARAGTAGPA